MTASKISKDGRVVALISFLVGTGLFALYFFTDEFFLLFAGLGFIIIVGVINLIYIIPIIRQIVKEKGNSKSLYITCGLMLLNVPIMLFYCWLTTILLNTMRITFVNETSSTLTDIKILGCEESHIAKLEPKEKKLVWLGITGDCSVNIEFKKDGKLVSENVSGYTSANMGQRMTHKLGSENPAANY